MSCFLWRNDTTSKHFLSTGQTGFYGTIRKNSGRDKRDSGLFKIFGTGQTGFGTRQSLSRRSLVLGPTKAYFGTVESQGRGSLHLHLLIWLNHEFTPAQLKENIQNPDFRDNLLKYLEDVVKEDLDLFRGKTFNIV